MSGGTNKFRELDGWLVIPASNHLLDPAPISTFHRAGIAKAPGVRIGVEGQAI
jgi:hypothetical protein